MPLSSMKESDNIRRPTFHFPISRKYRTKEMESRKIKQSKDPFEAAYEESPPESPIEAEEPQTALKEPGGVEDVSNPLVGPSPTIMKGKNKEEDEEEDEDNMEVELSKFPSSADPHKIAKFQSILAQFTNDQMSRYESFRRSALQKANMRRLLVSITGSQKISLPMTIVVCGIAKMFVGELVETARVVMTERRESGPIRPCHIREAYRRLKLEGKVPKRTVPRLFR